MKQNARLEELRELPKTHPILQGKKLGLYPFSYEIMREKGGAAPLINLWQGYQEETFPQWAAESLKQLHDGTLIAALKSLDL